ncbi:serine/threonine protein kinase [Massilia sp. ZL223]|uniref:serine/threonine protein kinase n=1 Tax=Massilia sp. ZL223 TaxID=2824904 RepID=UPI0035A2D5F7
MTDPKKTAADTHAPTRPNPDAGEGPSATGQEWDERALPLGSRVGEFEITGIIGKGGFGIVYLAWDHSLERVVALKEYMPTSFASRRNRTEVSPLSERHRETFQVGLNSFVNEARLLARFHSPSLVEVYRFWESNGTAYMAMPYYRGRTLGETVRSLPGPPSETWLKDLLMPLTDALLVLHAVQCYHRDVAPDNILILSDSGAPILLDFGAARRVIAGQAHALTVILKGGYAPIEQYGEFPGMQQGPWTDVYALASVVYWAITGETPPQATGRMIRDSYVPLAERAPPDYSQGFIAAIDRALAVMPDARTASIEVFRRELGLLPATERRPPPTKWSDDEATVVVAKPGQREMQVPAMTADMPLPHAPAAGSGELTRLAPEPARRRSLPMAAILGAAALVVAAGAGIWLFKEGKDAPPAAAPTVHADTTPPSPVPAAPAPAPVETRPASVPQSAAEALDLILARKAAGIGVEVDPARSRLQAGRAAQSLRYTASQPGHLYLIGLRSSPDEALEIISPRPGTAPVRAGKNGKLDLPGGALTPGTWKFVLVVAREAIDLRAYGWVVEDNAWKRRFGTGPASDPPALPWELPACAPTDPPCEASYGAAAFGMDVAAPPAAETKPAAAERAKPGRKTEEPARATHSETARAKPEAGSKAVDPECEKILVRLSLGESDPQLIDRMKTLKCN